MIAENPQHAHPITALYSQSGKTGDLKCAFITHTTGIQYPREK